MVPDGLVGGACGGWGGADGADWLGGAAGFGFGEWAADGRFAGAC